MALVKGMGVCLIPADTGNPCGRQIQEGEAVGTVTGGFNNKTPLMGHKRCADAYHYRIQQSERAKREAMMQRIDQSGPAGAVDITTGKDALEGGSIPLDKGEGVVTPPSNIIGHTPGVNFLGDLPEDITPAEAVALANEEKPRPAFDREAEARKNLDRMASYGATSLQDLKPPQVTRAYQSYAEGIVADPIPVVNAESGRVTLGWGDEILRIDPDDAKDLMRLIEVNADRARRQLL